MGRNMFQDVQFNFNIILLHKHNDTEWPKLCRCVIKHHSSIHPSAQAQAYQCAGTPTGTPPPSIQNSFLVCLIYPADFLPHSTP